MTRDTVLDEYLKFNDFWLSRPRQEKVCDRTDPAWFDKWRAKIACWSTITRLKNCLSSLFFLKNNMPTFSSCYGSPNFKQSTPSHA